MTFCPFDILAIDTLSFNFFYQFHVILYQPQTNNNLCLKRKIPYDVSSSFEPEAHVRPFWSWIIVWKSVSLRQNGPICPKKSTIVELKGFCTSFLVCFKIINFNFLFCKIEVVVKCFQIFNKGFNMINNITYVSIPVGNSGEIHDELEVKLKIWIYSWDIDGISYYQIYFLKRVLQVWNVCRSFVEVLLGSLV